MEYKKEITILAAVFIVIVSLFFVVKTINEIEQNKFIGQDIIPQNTINVSGRGEVFAAPDVVEITLSAEKENVSLTEAQSKASEAINKAIKFLKDSGVEEKDIKTTGYNIYPRYDYLKEAGQVFRGYVVNQTLNVKIRKTDDIGKILKGVTEAGVNQVGGINFKVDDRESVLREARQKAISDAKEKADKLAKDLGVKIVRLINYSESTDNNYPYPIYRAQSAAANTGGPEPEIPAGENSFVVNVSLTYQIK